MPITKVTQIIQLADIHLRLVKRHDEYRLVFNQLEKDIKKVLTDETVIVIVGDIVHAKLDMSPELVQITAEFFTKMADLAPTYVVAGNHDLNLSNMNRMDTLSPIIEMLDHPNLTYWKHSGQYKVANVDFYVFSILDDQDKWPTPCVVSDMKRPRIGVYHGPVYGAETDTGYMVTSRHVDAQRFDCLDIVLLGDIHTYQILQEADLSLSKPVIVYSSSLIQQNHGEASSGHGWVSWDVPARTHEFHELYNQYGYYTIDISDGTIPTSFNFPENVRLRIIRGDTDPTTVNKLLATIKKKTKVVEASITKGGSEKKEFTKGASVVELDKVSELETQTTLLTDWITDHIPACTGDSLKKVLEVHSDLYTRLKLDDKSRNIHWKPIKFTFSNMFSYGEDNYITFGDMKGIWGIFAPNASGKSSIMDAMMFCLYDKTPRAYKGDHIMNNRKTTFFCELIFEINGGTFTVQRTAKKNKAGEVKVDVNFFKTDANGAEESLNGTERRVTNASIKEYVGSYEDFVLTALSAQSGTSLFVDKTHSERKDLLCQFMGLDVFDQLHFLGNEDAKEVVALLKQHKGIQYVDELVKTQTELDEELSALTPIEDAIVINDAMIIDATQRKESYLSSKRPITATITDIEKLQTTKKGLCLSLERSLATLDDLESNTLTEQYPHQVELDAIDIKWASDTMSSRVIMERKLEQMSVEQNNLKLQIKTLEQQLDQQRAIKYNAECDVCTANNSVIIQQIADTENKSSVATEALVINAASLALLDHTIEETEFDYQLAKEQYLLHETLETAKKKHNAEYLDVTLKKQTELANIAKYENAVAKLDAEIVLYYANEESIKHNTGVDTHIREITNELYELNLNLSECNATKRQKELNLHALGIKKKELLDAIELSKTLEEKNSAYMTYLAAVGRNGIPHSFLLKALPAIESEVNNILGQISEFTVALELDGKNVNGMIQYSDDRSWPLENGSGMERFISGLAIRVALMSASSLPKPSFLIIDEGLGTLDVENLHNMTVFLDLLRNQFDTILLISHLETARDMADEILEISRDNGYSSIKH